MIQYPARQIRIQSYCDQRVRALNEQVNNVRFRLMNSSTFPHEG
jgi:hypothetical protein